MTLNVIGQSIEKIDARERVTGQTQYAGDLVMPGMLQMKILFSGKPHAKILSIDTSAAEKFPGVKAVFTARDVPVNEYGLQIKDQPVLCGPGSSKPGADIVRFVGDQVAIVIAETEEIAEKAMRLIKVEYLDLPVVTDPEIAILPEAYSIHPEIGTSNICVHDKIRKGNVEMGFAASDVIVEGIYKVPAQEHAYLQPEAGIAYIDEDGLLTIKAAGQWTHADQNQLAHSLNLPLEKIRVQYPAIGGAFGGREDLSVQIVLALAAWKLNQPVKIVWSRKESMIGHGKRHPMVIRAKWGASRDGKIIAAETTFIADGGAYMYTTNKVLGNATITQTGPYAIPNVKSDVIGVYTNNIPSAAFRGFGAPQAIFMAEMQMNKLAEKLRIDPVELRMRNALKPEDTLDVQTPPQGPVTIREVIEATAIKAGWHEVNGQWARKNSSQSKNQSHLAKGIGFAAGFKNIGFSFGYKENSWARIEIHGNSKIEKVVVYSAAADVGQGNHTILAQIAAEVIGVPIEKVEMITMDTLNMGNAGSASASRLTVMSGNAVKKASELSKARWDSEERPAIVEYTYYAPETTPFNKETGKCLPNFSYAYTAQGAEIELDIETGQLRIIRIISTHDVGKAINPSQVIGQIEGGVVQAQGYVMMENFITKNGYVLTDQLSTYLIPTIRDIPEKVESIILELPDELGPWGAKGLGELPYLPMAPVIISALHDAIGIWFDEFPLTPERILKGLGRI